MTNFTLLLRTRRFATRLFGTMFRRARHHAILTHSLGLVLLLWHGSLSAQTPGYGEQVIQWRVRTGETCEDVSKAIYGTAKHRGLVQRYNRVACVPGAPLEEGLTLVMPAKVTERPPAKLTSVKPEAQSRAPGGSWSQAATGQELPARSSVNTLSAGRAGIQFPDGTKVFLAENTLVVVYGTASQSAVSKSEAPTPVLLEAGEVKAGLSALRGEVEVATPDGGVVGATSKDAVVSLVKGKTNVSVFDGKARVQNAGTTVEVPKNFGTKFLANKPPDPPRPLPPAPGWTSAPLPVVLAMAEAGDLRASWASVPDAKLYRFEIARDAEFDDLVVREQVEADVLSFRAEKFPPGNYFVRVRAIDNDDFLGIATVARVALVEARWSRGTGTLEAGKIAGHRYTTIELKNPGGLEVALGTAGDFAAAPASLPLHAAAGLLRMRTSPDGSGSEFAVDLHALVLEVTIDGSLAPGAPMTIHANTAPGQNVDLATLSPTARLVTAQGVRFLDLAPLGAGMGGSMQRPASDGVLEFLDSEQNVLHREAVRGFIRVPPPRYYRTLGVSAPLVGLDPDADLRWWAPSPRGAVAAGIGAAGIDAETSLEATLQASGSIGPVGADLVLRTPSLIGNPGAIATAIGGVHFRFADVSNGDLQAAVAVRVGLPLQEDAPPSFVDSAVALGGGTGDFSWLTNANVRVRVPATPGGSEDLGTQYSISGGATYDFLDFLRAYAVLDTSLRLDSGSPAIRTGTPGIRGGFAAGLELGTWIFGSLGGRVSPWRDDGGYVFGQAAIGFRTF